MRKSLNYKVVHVRKLLNEASMHTETFSKASNLHCQQGCYSCCLKRDLYASSLEFFPLAYELYKEGTAETVYDKIGNLPQNAPCYFFTPFEQNGGCSRYNDRGLICRLFGFSSNTDKNDKPRLITCKGIKQTDAFQNLLPSVLGKSPNFSDFYIRLASLDFQLANEQLQINGAIHKALEIVLNYESLRNRRIPA